MFKFVLINKIIYLWEKETKNQEEEKSITEVMVREDLERLQNRLHLQKKNLNNSNFS